MGDFFGIPTPKDGQVIVPSEEMERYETMSNLLVACTKGILSEVFEDGIYTLIDNGDGTYTLTLAASGSIRALYGRLNGCLIDRYTTITWEKLPEGSFYYLYVTSMSQLYLNPESVNPFYSTIQRSENDYSVLYLATVDLTSGAVLDTNPTGKVYHQDFKEHMEEDTNPHSTNWTQNTLRMFEQIEFDIDVSVAAGALFSVSDERTGTNNTIESTGDVSFKDQHQTTLRKLSDSSNTYITTTNETFIGAINECFTASEGFGSVILHKPHTLLKFDVKPLNYINDAGTRKYYVGATNQSLTPSQTNYIYLDSTGALALSTSSFPSNAEMRLATVVCDATTVTSFTDSRPFVNLEGLDIHNDFSSIQGGSSTQRYHLTSAQHTEATQYAGASQNGLVTSSVFNYIPVDGEKDALDGTYETPGSSNVYMTEIDPQLSLLGGRDNFNPILFNEAVFYWISTPTTYSFGEASLDALTWHGIYPMSDANDYSGSYNNLANTSVTFVPGVHNNCAAFSSSLSSNLSGWAFAYTSGPFSFSLFLNVTSLPMSGDAYILGIWDSGTPSCQWALRFAFDGWGYNFEFVVSTDGATVTDRAVNSVPYGSFGHVAGVFYGDGVTPFELWVDGSPSYSSGPSPASLWSAWANFYVGAETSWMGPTSFLDGYVDELYITPSALTPSQISWLSTGFADALPQWTTGTFIYADTVMEKTSVGLGLNASSTEKLSFFTPAPVIQQNHIPDPSTATATTVSDNTGGSIGNSVEAVTAIGGADQSNINNNFASLTDDIDDLITDFDSIRTAVDALNLRLETYGWNKTS